MPDSTDGPTLPPSPSQPAAFPCPCGPDAVSFWGHNMPSSRPVLRTHTGCSVCLSHPPLALTRSASPVGPQLLVTFSDHLPDHPVSHPALVHGGCVGAPFCPLPLERNLEEGRTLLRPVPPHPEQCPDPAGTRHPPREDETPETHSLAFLPHLSEAQHCGAHPHTSHSPTSPQCLSGAPVPQQPPAHHLFTRRVPRNPSSEVEACLGDGGRHRQGGAWTWTASVGDGNGKCQQGHL